MERHITYTNYPRTLKEGLQHAIHGNISEVQLSQLILISCSIAETYLATFRHSVSQLCLQQGLTIVDLSFDCIAEVFGRDQDNKFWQLENFAASLNEEFDQVPEQQLWLAFKSFIIRVADVQLARLYAQADPSGAKIHRNIRDCLRRSQTLQLTKDLRGLVVRPKRENSLDHLDSFPLEELERRFHAIARSNCTTMELMNVFHSVVVEQDRYRRSVPLADLVQIVRKVYDVDSTEKDRQVDDSTRREVFTMEGLSEEEIQEICRQAEFALKEKIAFTYFAHGKVNRKQAEAMSKAFHDILTDWSEVGALGLSLYEYLQRYLPIDEEVYEVQFKAKMEYLLKVAREEVAARLMREL